MVQSLRDCIRRENRFSQIKEHANQPLTVTLLHPSNLSSHLGLNPFLLSHKLWINMKLHSDVYGNAQGCSSLNCIIFFPRLPKNSQILVYLLASTSASPFSTSASQTHLHLSLYLIASILPFLSKLSGTDLIILCFTPKILSNDLSPFLISSS